jgi:hypothetical protein
MVTHMKTTVDIADAVLDEARQVAAEQRVTLRELIEDGLRRAIEARRSRETFTLHDAGVGGSGVQSGIDEGDWAGIRDLIYEGRGS